MCVIKSLGLVFGDIGTSPLYAFQEIFQGAHSLPAFEPRVFGAASLVFWTLTLVVSVKYATFILRADNAQFRTGWFIESVISAALIVLVIRTRKPFFRSKPGKLLLAATLGIIALTLVVPFSPIADLFGFTPLPLYYLAFIFVVMAVYVMVTEAVKKVFYKKVKL